MDVDLAVLLFGITLAVEVIGWIGKDTLADIAYIPFSSLFGPPLSKEQRAKKAEILKLRQELAATSSQDEFSKWARIRRKLDKSVQDLESHNSASTSAKKQFSQAFKGLLFMLTTVAPFIVTSYYRKAGVFYLPPGWFGPVTWWMSLPSGPTGGVACGIWTFACKRTINTVKDIVVELVGTKALPVVQPQPVPVGVSVGGPAPVTAADDQKDKVFEKESEKANMRDEL